jgi:hypothetical protein
LLYKALAVRLGILPPELVIAITAFHKNMQEIRTGLPLLIDNPERGIAPDHDEPGRWVAGEAFLGPSLQSPKTGFLKSLLSSV